MHQCDYCEKVFTQKSSLYRHVRNYHQEESNKRKQSTNDYPHTAKIARIEDHTYCQQPLLNPPTQPNTSQLDDSIQPNVSIQTPLQPDVSDMHQCEYCDEVFRWFSCLNLHVEIYHQSNTPPEQAYISNSCVLCKKTYSTVETAMHHMESAHQIKFRETSVDFQCMFCNDIFISSQQASIHMMNFHKKEHNRKYDYFALRLDSIRETYKRYDNVNYYPVEKFIPRYRSRLDQD